LLWVVVRAELVVEGAGYRRAPTGGPLITSDGRAPTGGVAPAELTMIDAASVAGGAKAITRRPMGEH
jgi:hypothetical protein